MNLKDKLATAKDKIKTYTPEIIGFSVVVVSAATTLALKHLLDSQKGTQLRFAKDDQEWMIQEDVTMTYSVDGSDYSVRYLGDTPPN